MPAFERLRLAGFGPSCCLERGRPHTFRHFCMQIANIANMLRAKDKPAKILADRTRSEPTTAGIAEHSADWPGGLSGLALVERRAPRRRRRRRIRDLRRRHSRRHSSPRRFAANPAASIAWSMRDVPTDVYATLTGSKLVRVNRATQEIEPALAESWTTSPDNLTLHADAAGGCDAGRTGRPSRPRTWCLPSRPSTTPGSTACWPARSRSTASPSTVTAPDARTVVITLPSAFGPGIALLDNVHLAPKHKLEAALKAGTFAQALGVSTPPAELAVLGPFKLTSYAAGQRLVFDRNPAYWKKDAAGVQLPYLDQVVLEIVPDQNAELVRLQSGQIDMLQQQVRPEDIATLRPLEQQGKVQADRAGGRRRSRLVLLQPARPVLGEGSAARLDHPQGIPPGDLARDRSRGLRQHRVPRRRRADLGAGHPRQHSSGFRPTCRATAIRSSAPRKSSTSIGLDQSRRRRVARG